MREDSTSSVDLSDACVPDSSGCHVSVGECSYSGSKNAVSCRVRCLMCIAGISRSNSGFRSLVNAFAMAKSFSVVSGSARSDGGGRG